MRFGGEGAKSLKAPAPPRGLLCAPRSWVPEPCGWRGASLTLALIELCCRWALGCLGYTLVGLGQGHIARQAAAVVGALCVLTGATLAQGLGAAHLLTLVDVCKKKDRGELTAD